MRRVGIVLLVALVLGAALIAATARSSATAGTSGAKADNITIWVGWSAAELKAFKGVVAEYDKKHSDVTVKVVGGINDDKITAAIRSGKVPDVVSSFTSANVGQYCNSGAWIDLKPFLSKDKIDVNMFPKTSAVLHAVQGEAVRSAAPRRRLRLLLQQEDVQGGRAHEPAEDDVTADRVREEADEEEFRRLDQGRRVQPVPRFLRRECSDLSTYAPLFGAKYVDGAASRSSRRILLGRRC